MPQLRNRRGATIILVAMMMVVLLGFTAIAVEFAQAYAYKAQLQSAADAGALAGAVSIAANKNDQAQAFAKTYADTNPVAAQKVSVPLADVKPGTWNWDTGQWQEVENWADAKAVEVTARHSFGLSFGRVIGWDTLRVTAVGRAALGTVTSSGCLKPWAVPYENVLYALNKPGENPLTYELSDADVAYLRDSKKEIYFKVSTENKTGGTWDAATGSVINGNFYAVQFDAYRREDGTLYSPGPTPGADAYRDAIATCQGQARVGDWLLVENGDMDGPTRQGAADLCGVNGAPQQFSCPDVEIEVAIWNKFVEPKEVQIKYIGKFVVTGFDKGALYGYLIAKSASSGGVSAGTGPIMKPVLVQ